VGPGTPDADILHVTNHYTPGVKGGGTTLQGVPAGEVRPVERRIGVEPCVYNARH
jgi:hypothetical protein